MSVHLTAHNLRNDDEAEVVHISNGEWVAITAAAKAFGIDVSPPTSHDPHHYSPEVLREMADRIEQLKDAPMWLRWLASEGGAHLS